MTPIGHFASCAVATGLLRLTTTRETLLLLGYYVLFLVAFAVTTSFVAPGHWAMHFYDWFSNVAGLVLLVLWLRAEPRRQLALAIFIGALLLAAFTHVFDRLFLLFAPALPQGRWRPHLFMHTPVFAVAYCALWTPLVALAMRTRVSWGLWLALVFGYVLHIFGDAITYDFPIYWLWPVHDVHSSLAVFFQPPGVRTAWLGNPAYVVAPPSVLNPEGWVVYKAEFLVNALLVAAYGFTLAFRAVQRRPGLAAPPPAQKT